jgi:hypothetical protein
MEKEKSKAQKELDDYRETKIAYLSTADKDMDFSKVNDPDKKPTEPTTQKK